MLFIRPQHDSKHIRSGGNGLVKASARQPSWLFSAAKLPVFWKWGNVIVHLCQEGADLQKGRRQEVISFIAFDWLMNRFTLPLCSLLKFTPFGPVYSDEGRGVRYENIRLWTIRMCPWSADTQRSFTLCVSAHSICCSSRLRHTCIFLLSKSHYLLLCSMHIN